MKRIVWIIIAVAAVGYFSNSYMEKRAKREAERAEVERVEHATKAAVSQMASRTNSVTGWETNLSKGERFRFEPILTVELERLWLQQRPILFIGSIKDIATRDQSQYVVLVERSLFSSFDYMFGTELQLSLLSNKDRVDSFLKEHPDLFKDFGFKNGVAVVAQINSIRTTYVSGEEGEREEVKIGDGELIDLLYTGDVRF
ncbi:MAG: hypothetical protein C4528_06215 [Gammaproteobacteria bacterium]|nr:MAG: hypothetical protein C4528_06215 [Gammaproteobacteria bacterium]